MLNLYCLPQRSGVGGKYGTDSKLPIAWREAIGMDDVQMQQSVWNCGAVVALAPNVGSALKRSWQGAGGTVVGGALGIAIMSAVGAAVGSGSYTKHPLRTARPFSSVPLLCMHPRQLVAAHPESEVACCISATLSCLWQVVHLSLLLMQTLLLARSLCTFVPAIRRGNVSRLTHAPLMLLCTLTLDHGFQAVWGSVLLAIGAGLLMLQKARFHKLRYASDVALLTYVVVSVPGAPPWSLLTICLPVRCLGWYILHTQSPLTHAPSHNPPHACSRPFMYPCTNGIERRWQMPRWRACRVIDTIFFSELLIGPETMHSMSITASAPGDQGCLHARELPTRCWWKSAAACASASHWHSGLRSDEDNTMETIKLAANACIGVGIALLVAGTCAPVRAREALRRSTAQLLEQLGDYAFFVLGEFCQARTGRGEPTQPVHARFAMGF